MLTEREKTLTRAEFEIAGLHSSITDHAVISMNFLNNVTGKYPEAVSFASGAPFSGLFEIEDVPRYVRSFCAHLEEEGMSEEQISRLLFQYGRTKGIIHDAVARNLAVDEGVHVDAEAVVVTVGCHEAIYLVLRALRAAQSDVVLAVSPSYVGFTAVANLVDMPVLPVATGPLGIDFEDLVEQLRRARRTNLRPRALYVVPDFANPSGISMSRSTRDRLLDIAKSENLLLLEDNPYGLLGGGGRVPTLKALDRHRQVVYLGTFAKTGLPGARVGYVVADQLVKTGDGECLFADRLARIKATLTVNTSPIAQAVIGGKLVEHDFSLIAANTREIELYRKNLHQLLDGLERRFGEGTPLHGEVSWNSPAGGFFVVVTVPFEVDDRLVELSAGEFGVIWVPMRYFYGGTGGTNQIRLSISALTGAQIESGLDRFAAMILNRHFSVS